jgi:ligand-binding sensor domain-containing protein
MPSDMVYNICIIPDWIQWFGTDMGVARHFGYNTLEKWTVFNKENGLVDNFVQAIATDKSEDLWFGTKGGISVYNSSQGNSYTINDGLNSNNILCITVDKTGMVWLGSDNGVKSFNNGEFECYK